MTAERELLLGILADHLGLSQSASVMDSGDTWRAAPGVSLADQLERAGLLGAEQRRMLDAMVDALISVHGGDPKKALGALGGAKLLVTFGAGKPGPDAPPLVGEENARVTPEASNRYRFEGADAREIGRGGIGRVLAAFDEHLGREIALKEIQLRHRVSDSQDGQDESRAILGRFLREARVTAQLEHPNIVPVYELGQRASGEYYYTMKLVRGRTLADALEKAGSLEERLRLLPHFVDLCQAIAYAHSRGVVHRDIKPQNVMVGEFGQTLVLDWGLAKVRGKADIRGSEIQERGARILHEAQPIETLPGTAYGTPAYMSPEQGEGKIDEIDERSDVWSLGVVLYQILAGRPPFMGETPIATLVMVLREAVKPVRSICPEAPLELAAVAERALTREKRDRYQSARELAAEVEAFQSGARVEAYRYGNVELLKRFLAAHRAEAIVAAIALVVLIATGIGAYFQVLGERDRAVRAEIESRKSVADALTERARSSALIEDFTAAELYAASALTYGDHPDARGLLMALPSEWRPLVLWDAVTWAGCQRLELSPDEATVACVSSPEVVLLDKESGADLRALKPDGGWVQAVAFSADGARLAWALDDGRVEVLDRASGERKLRVTTTGSAASALAFTADGSRLSAVGSDGSLRIYDAASGKELSKAASLEPNQVRAAAFAPGGRAMAVAASDGSIRVQRLDPPGPPRRFSAHATEILALAFSADASRLASASRDGTAAIWDLAGDPRLVRRVSGHDSDVTAIAFDPTGDRVLTASKDRVVRVFDLGSGDCLARLGGHPVPLTAIALSKDGKTLITAGADRSVRAASVRASEGPPASVELPEPVLALAFAASGRGLGAGGADGHLRLIQFPTGAVRVDLPAHTRRITSVDFSPDERLVATAGLDQRVRVYALANGAEAAALPELGSAALSVAFTPDSRGVAVGLEDRTIRVIDVGTAREVRRLEGHQGPVRSVAFAPDGQRLVSAGADRTVRLWSVEDGREVARLDGHTEAVARVAFSLDGAVIASASSDRSVRIWDVEKRAETARFAHERAVRAVALSPDGQLLATASEAGDVRLITIATGVDLARFEAHRGEANAVAFSPDGAFLISGGEDRVVRFYDLATHALTGAELLARARSDFGLKIAGARIGLERRLR